MVNNGRNKIHQTWGPFLAHPRITCHFQHQILPCRIQISCLPFLRPFSLLSFQICVILFGIFRARLSPYSMGRKNGYLSHVHSPVIIARGCVNLFNKVADLNAWTPANVRKVHALFCVTSTRATFGSPSGFRALGRSSCFERASFDHVIIRPEAIFLLPSHPFVVPLTQT